MQDLMIVALLIFIRFYGYQVSNFSRIFSRFLFLATLVFLLQITVDQTISDTIYYLSKSLICLTFLPFLFEQLGKLEINPGILIGNFIFGVTVSDLIDLVQVNTLAASGRSEGLSGHPVYFGITSTTALSFVFFYKFHGRLRNLISKATIPILILSIVRSGTSTSVLIFGVVCAILVGTKLLDMYQALNAGLLIFTLTLFGLKFSIFEKMSEKLYLVLHPTHSPSLSSTDGVSTLQIRIQSIKNAFPLIREYFLTGVGFNSTRMNTFGKEYPHNFFVLGLLGGGIIYLFMQLYFLLRIVSFYDSNFSDEFKIIYIICFVSAWIALLTNPIAYDRSTFVPLCFCFFLQEHSRKSRILDV